MAIVVTFKMKRYANQNRTVLRIEGSNGAAIELNEREHFNPWAHGWKERRLRAAATNAFEANAEAGGILKIKPTVIHENCGGYNLVEAEDGQCYVAHGPKALRCDVPVSKKPWWHVKGKQ